MVSVIDLYPLCRKFRDTFVLAVCPLITFLNYGLLSHYYGSIAVGTDFFKETVLNTGVMRGLAGISLGTILYKICRFIKDKNVTIKGRIVFTIAELLGFVYFFYAMNEYVKSKYDYVLIFVIFGLLIIGISGISFTSYLWSSKWTKPFGIASTLIVLNHYCYAAYLRSAYGSDVAKTEKAWLYIPLVIGASLISYGLGRLIEYLMKLISKAKLFEKRSEA